MKRKRIVCTIINEPNYDQRMIRICTSLQQAGYDVLLIGRKKPGSRPLIRRPFRQIRIWQGLNRGKFFFASYNIKLFFTLLFTRMDAVCAIDLDTILPVYYISLLKRKRRVYDAHELFCELEEVVTRPTTKKMWKWIERHTVPHFRYGYTVNESYVAEYQQMYGLSYAVVRNATVLRPFSIPEKKERYILYQGSVNKGRCFEELIPAMKLVDARLIICGEGNFYEEAKQLTILHGVENKVIFEGFVLPDALPRYTELAYIGITLFVATSRSNELSLANRFFDYMHSGVPQLAPCYPEYERINNEFQIAHLLKEITPESIAEALNLMLHDDTYYNRLQQNCMQAREVYCWQQEEKRLLNVYQNLFADA